MSIKAPSGSTFTIVGPDVIIDNPAHPDKDRGTHFASIAHANGTFGLCNFNPRFGLTPETLSVLADLLNEWLDRAGKAYYVNNEKVVVTGDGSAFHSYNHKVTDYTAPTEED
ncbi:hypothetical protein CQ010_01390 [Arthrobacter sp. MYb211]|uniref:hypothetical protein n=1 Tax=unclassified Arthrobacter TaxID=235627 RepID=UPI000CFBCE51|nr:MULTISPECIES: hypothetical protein [unclassified Arthrobacter]PRA13328.1 hypothetical protein CQ015_03645 [Arthrobacter sp. MYb221]PRC10525.1 hypothetical protein CQ010_01390 [Arthrobacter sp. MYb211]